MRSLFHHFAYVVLVALLVNSAGWTFNSEVLEDVNSGELIAVAQITDNATDASLKQTKVVKGNCNHGCHAVNHLLGQVSHPLTVAVLTGTTPPVAHIFSAFLSRAPNAQFRPPRVLPLV